MEKKSPFQRFVLFAFIGAATICISHLSAEDEPKLVVHEWGVLGVGNSNGTPVLGATDRFLESLPDFVFKNDLLAPPQFVEQQMNNVWKPVIHLYGAEGQKVEVTVKVAKGFPIVYFPKPELKMATTNVVNGDGRFGALTQAQAITWKFSLSKRRPPTLLSPPVGHWWNPARRIPSDYVVMDDGSAGERFLFYEGTTYENPSVRAVVSKDSIQVGNVHTAESAPVILILNDHGSRSGVYLDPIAASGTKTISKGSLKPWDDETLFAHCRKQWEACGMTPEEAVGIVESWRPELLNTPGFLLISRIPEPVYETIFPIVIKPAPAELERACLVFDNLVGQDARKHWLPLLRKECLPTIEELDTADFKQRLVARSKIIKWGEVATPFVNEVLARPGIEPQLKMASSTLLAILTESPVCANQQPPASPSIDEFLIDLDVVPEVIEIEELRFRDFSK